jgi:protein-disulfide isomerase
MHDELFRRQAEWSRLAEPAEFLASVAEGLGADMARYRACIDSGRTLAEVHESVDLAKGLGFTGTPSFEFTSRGSSKAHQLVGAQPAPVFAEWVDSMLAIGAPPKREKPGLPFWATAEGLAPDPARAGFTLAGAAYKGNPEAPLVVVEFVDFQCPFCKRHALETQPTLDREFVDTGKVMWVVKNLPLRKHRNAIAAGVAAECAGAQGKLWDMYHVLFEAQEDWSDKDPDQALPPLAERIGLDRASFERCLDSRAPAERVIADYFDAQQGRISNTPTFLFVAGGEGVRFAGAKTLRLFRLTVQSRYERAKAQAQEAEAKPVD